MFNNWTPLGTPLAWTSDNPENDFYNSLNPGLGDHTWLLDVDMDCSQTMDGWFEFNTIYTYGGTVISKICQFIQHDNKKVNNNSE